MKNLLFPMLFFFCSSLYAQGNQDPMIVLDAQKIGYMKALKKEMEALNSADISTVTVYKDSISKKYGSDYGVIIITTKKYILDTFYKNFIENSPLKDKIKTPDDLKTIGVVTDKPNSKNQPYDELSQYIYTNTFNEKIKKVAGIFFIKPEDAIKINAAWTNGAIEISSEVE